MNKEFGGAALTSLALALLACAPAIGAGGARLTFPAKDDTTVVEGILVEARCYLNTGAIAGNHTFCAFWSARANLPLAVLTPRQELIFLTSSPGKLADQVTRQVRVRGLVTPNRQLLRPMEMQVASGGGWAAVSL